MNAKHIFVIAVSAIIGGFLGYFSAVKMDLYFEMICKRKQEKINLGSCTK
jgi:hypothetical protein